MCEHLVVLDQALRTMGIKETYRGQPWSDNCREWVYYDCVLDLDKIKHTYVLPDCVSVHVNDDMRSGMEAGLVCDLCHDAVMGVHPHFGKGKTRVG